jgi:hypothetical protein
LVRAVFCDEQNTAVRKGLEGSADFAQQNTLSLFPTVKDRSEAKPRKARFFIFLRKIKNAPKFFLKKNYCEKEKT